MTPMLPKFVPIAKSNEEVEEEVEKAFEGRGFEPSQPDDIARTIVWLLSEDSAPVLSANINVGAGIP